MTITGKVNDETGQPLPGVTVKQKETSNTTVTDAKGQYTLTVPDDKTTIIFSYIGYETQELTARDLQSGSIIILKATMTNLKEVVVSKGYYNITQELNTGTSSNMKSRALRRNIFTQWKSSL